VLIAIVLEGSPMPELEARKAAAAANDDLVAAGVLAIAGVAGKPGFGGALFRAIATGLHQMSRHRYPMRVFGTTQEAVHWAVQHLPRPVDTEVLVRDVDDFRRVYAERFDSPRLAG
jgi:hypothetical protein